MTKKRRIGKEVVFHDLTYDLMLGAVREVVPRAVAYDDERIRRVLVKTDWDRPREETGEPAWAALVQVEDELENLAYMLAQEFSSAEWLWYLRRIEWFFHTINDNPTTAPYVQALSESIAAMSAKSAPGLTKSGMFLTYPIEPSIAFTVMKLATLAAQIYQNQGSLRWAGKGAKIKAVPNEPPTNDPTPELEAMVRLWDRRMGQGNATGLERAGLYSHTLGTAPDPATALGIVPIVGRTPEGNFGLTAFHLGEVPATSDQSLPPELRWPREVLDLVALLWATIWGQVIEKESARSLLTLTKAGYRVVNKQRALIELAHAIAGLREARLGGVIPETVIWDSPGAVLSRLQWSDVSIWPPTMGPPIRAAGDWLFVDLYAASRRLHLALARPPLDGQMANDWARHFDTGVQTAINSSPWKPSPANAEQGRRERHLRANGERITDIDAIGERGDRLLLVSCKAWPFSVAWDRGEYSAVLGMAGKVSEAAADWATKMDRFRAVPKGDNYDFTGYREIIGVVVSPSIPWTTDSRAIIEVQPGLRAVVSAAELNAWINGGTATVVP